MYNRYIPQADGTYRRNRVPDRYAEPPSSSPKNDRTAPDSQDCVSEEVHCTPPVCPVSNGQKSSCKSRPTAKKENPIPKDAGIDSFLKRLLPRDFDTGDLLIVILLLLMAGDCPEDQNSALLTLLLYFFM